MGIVEKIRKYKAVISILVIACLVISSFYVYFEFFTKEQIVEEIPVKEVDDNISPLTQQAVFMQIKRTRRKDIIDQTTYSGTLANLVKNFPINNKEFKLDGEIIDGAAIIGQIEGRLSGKGWDKKPSFSYVAVLDGYEWKGYPLTLLRLVEKENDRIYSFTFSKQLQMNLSEWDLTKLNHLSIGRNEINALD